MRVFRTGLLASAVLGGVLLAHPAAAWSTEEGGFQAGAFMVRARLIDVIPQTSSSSISGIGGDVDVTMINGRIVVDGGVLKTAEMDDLIAEVHAVVPGLFHRRARWLAEHHGGATSPVADHFVA